MSDLVAKREKQLESINNKIQETSKNISLLKENKSKQLPLLESVSRGLYDELDKLCKKAPAEPITDLVLEQLNDIIKETKEMNPSDLYVQRIKEFVPAGDNPEHRDAVVVLRLVRTGLDRYSTEIVSRIKAAEEKLNELTTIQVALELFLNDEDGEIGYVAEYDDVSEYVDSIVFSWFTRTDPPQFNFAKLDEIDIDEYYGEPS